MATFSSHDSLIDIRDVISTVEALQERIDNERENLSEFRKVEAEALALSKEEQEELKTLTSLLSELAGYDGDEQWNGDWYPVTLIKESEFVAQMKELLQDVGELPRKLPNYIVIDWEATAENLKADYSTVEFDGATYYYR